MKLLFLVDTFYKGELLFEKNKVYDVPTELGWADRWIKRGAQIVDEVTFEPVPVDSGLRVTMSEEVAVDLPTVEVELAPEVAETNAELTVSPKRGRKSLARK